jgi:hypothetical protein
MVTSFTWYDITGFARQIVNYFGTPAPELLHYLLDLLVMRIA